ncbi:cytochrome P450 [Streptomyces canus]|uniref:cytochrome P450 n=1 Tax=Streptomyces canus TaxID=58343 RepID=UPI00386D6B7E
MRPINEALRLCPAFPTTPWFLHQTCGIGGHRVPAGTRVVLSIWGLHRRPDLYPDPETLRPERFLERPPSRGTWMPLGTGPTPAPPPSLATPKSESSRGCPEGRAAARGTL